MTEKIDEIDDLIHVELDYNNIKCIVDYYKKPILILDYECSKSSENTLKRLEISSEESSQYKLFNKYYRIKNISPNIDGLIIYKSFLINKKDNTIKRDFGENLVYNVYILEDLHIFHSDLQKYNPDFSIVAIENIECVCKDISKKENNGEHNGIADKIKNKISFYDIPFISLDIFSKNLKYNSKSNSNDNICIKVFYTVNCDFPFLVSVQHCYEKADVGACDRMLMGYHGVISYMSLLSICYDYTFLFLDFTNGCDE
jgi:hypothetical protein